MWLAAGGLGRAYKKISPVLWIIDRPNFNLSNERCGAHWPARARYGTGRLSNYAYLRERHDSTHLIEKVLIYLLPSTYPSRMSYQPAPTLLDRNDVLNQLYV